MGQNYSCKCNNENDQKKSSELKLENKTKRLNETDNKSLKQSQESMEFKNKSSRTVNKTLEQIINTNEGINYDYNKQASSLINEENVIKKKMNLIEENGKNIEETVSPNNLSNFTSSNNFKITSPINESRSSVCSVTNIKKDFKKMGIVTGPKNQKKFIEGLNFSQLNCNNTNRAPLEIINEYHREYSVEALFEMTPPKTTSSLPPKSGNKLNIIDSLKLTILPTINHQSSGDHASILEGNLNRKLKNSPLNSDQKRKNLLSISGGKTLRQVSQESGEKSQNNINSSGFLKKNGNSNLLASDESETLRNIITNRNISIEIKKEKTLADRIKNINIFSLFPKERLLNSGIEDILFQGEIFKYTVPEAYFASPYSSKYCVLNRSEFRYRDSENRYFKSKEAFFRLGQPLFTLPISNIVCCSYLKEVKEKSNKVLHQFNIIIDHHEKPEVWIDKQRKFHRIQIREDKFNSVLKDNDLSKINETKKEEKRAKKINLLVNTKKIKEDQRKNEYKEFNNTSLIFAGDEEKVIKWLKIFEFVLNKN